MKSLAELDKELSSVSGDVVQCINDIVDEMSFVETDKFIGSTTSLGFANGEGVVSGFATIDDIQVGIFAINGNVLLGGIGKRNSEKISKCVENSVKMDAPVVGIIDTSGARFAEGIEAMEGYSSIIKAFSDAYGIVPTTLVVKGNNFGILSYLPAFCDFTICYEKSVMATTSPLILAAQTTDDVASVGTAEKMAVNGVSSFTVKDDSELKSVLSKVLDIVAVPVADNGDDGNRTSDLLTVGISPKSALTEILDADSFIEVKKDYACEVITGFARLNGIAVGIIANNTESNFGDLTVQGADKISDFINTLESFDLPLVNFVDCKGAVKCAKCQTNLIKAIGEMIYALNVATIEKIALITGNALGVAYVAFANKNVYDYVIAWENAHIGMLDGRQSAQLVYADQIAAVENKEAALAEFAEAYEEDNSVALKVAEKGFIDNVIEPQLTRLYLIAALQAFYNKR